MPPKISLFFGTKRKRENDLTQSSQTPNTPFILNSSPPSSQDSSKRLRLNVTPKPVPNPAPNPFRTGNTTPTTSLTPPRISLFSKYTKKNNPSPADDSRTNDGPTGSQSSTASTRSSTSLTPPKTSLFSNFTKKKVETETSSHSPTQLPKPFRNDLQRPQETTAATTSPSSTRLRLKLTPRKGPATDFSSSSARAPPPVSDADIGATLQNAILLYSSSPEPDTPARRRSDGLIPASPDWMIGDSALSESEAEDEDGYLSSSPEPELLPQQPWNPSPELLAALKAADETELSESKQKLFLIKMQLSWSVMGGVEHSDLRGLRGNIKKLEKRMRNLERKLGLREDAHEIELDDEQSDSDASDDEDAEETSQTNGAKEQTSRTEVKVEKKKSIHFETSTPRPSKTKKVSEPPKSRERKSAAARPRKNQDVEEESDDYKEAKASKKKSYSYTGSARNR